MKNYSLLKTAYPVTKEQFFVGYAVNGPIVDKKHGGRLGLPETHPISGPVKEPSPLNNRWMYEQEKIKIDGIL